MQTDAPPGVGAKSDDEFDALGGAPSPDKTRAITIDGKSIEILPMRMRQIRLFSPYAKPLIGWLNEQLVGKTVDEVVGNPLLFFDLQETHGEAMNHAAAIAAGLSYEQVENLEPDVWLELVVKVWAANLDFFVRRLLPAVAAVMRDQAGALSGIEKTLMRGRGLIRSKA